MGMFDWYAPAAALRCPVCDHALQTWQGKDGPCALFVWHEGKSAPVEQRMDDESELSLVERQEMRLPVAFTIYSYDCPTHQPIDATCSTIDGVWLRTEGLSYSRGR